MAKVSGSSLIRVFVAVDMPDAVRKEIKRVQDKIKELDLLEGSYVDHEKAHLTLRFIGYIEPSALPPIKKILKNVKFGKIDACLGRLGAFGSKDSVRVIWIEVLSEQIVDLAKKISKELSFGKAQMQRPFQAHLTLVRVKNAKDVVQLKEELREIKIEPIEFSIDKFILKQSTLTSKGPIYITLENYSMS